MFYAAMYALKGREDRRAASALQQMTGVDLGGQPGTPACPAPRAALRAALPLPFACGLAGRGSEAMRVLPAGRAGAPRAARAETARFCLSARLMCVQLVACSPLLLLRSKSSGCTCANGVAPDVVLRHLPSAGNLRLWPLWHHLRRQHLPAGASLPHTAAFSKTRGLADSGQVAGGNREHTETHVHVRGRVIRHILHAHVNTSLTSAPPSM